MMFGRSHFRFQDAPNDPLRWKVAQEQAARGEQVFFAFYCLLLNITYTLNMKGTTEKASGSLSVLSQLS